jgi:hypothetical protein
MFKGVVVKYSELSWVETCTVFDIKTNIVFIKTNIVFIVETVVLAALSLLFNLQNTGCLVLKVI